MPTDELASEKAPWSDSGRGLGMGRASEGELSWRRHHVRSAGRPCGGVRGMNGLLPKVPMNASSSVT
jgi:hypothetical protein